MARAKKDQVVTVEQAVQEQPKPKPKYDAKNLKEGDIIVASSDLYYSPTVKYSTRTLADFRGNNHKLIPFKISKRLENTVVLETEYNGILEIPDSKNTGQYINISSEECGWTDVSNGRRKRFNQIFSYDYVSSYIVDVQEAPLEEKIGTFHNPIKIDVEEGTFLEYEVNLKTHKCVVKYEAPSFSERIESFWDSFKDLFSYKYSVYTTDLD